MGVQDGRGERVALPQRDRGGRGAGAGEAARLPFLLPHPPLGRIGVDIVLLRIVIEYLLRFASFFVLFVSGLVEGVREGRRI